MIGGGRAGRQLLAVGTALILSLPVTFGLIVPLDLNPLGSFLAGFAVGFLCAHLAWELIVR